MWGWGARAATSAWCPLVTLGASAQGLRAARQGPPPVSNPPPTRTCAQPAPSHRLDHPLVRLRPMLTAHPCGQVRRNCAAFATAATSTTAAATAAVNAVISAAPSAVSTSTDLRGAPWRVPGSFNLVLLDRGRAPESATDTQVHAHGARASNAPRLACVGRRVAVELLLSVRHLSPSSRAR